MKTISMGRFGDQLEVIIRDSCFAKVYEGKANVNNKKELEQLLIDLKAKGVDLIGIVKKKMLQSDNDWF